MLRRTRQQVLAELPEMTENCREITLSGAQRELYESLRLAQHQRVQQAVAERGLAASGIVMLDALLKLRQVCCDPRLVKLESVRKTKRSAKLEQLRELVPPLVEEGRRILIFSQFTEMLALIGEALEKEEIPFTTLTGDTPGRTRTQRVALFQQGEIPVFLISLKAGGTGLNLTAADTVIHYDPWWNPAVEAQATGRAHRLVHHATLFELNVDSYRRRTAMENKRSQGRPATRATLKTSHSVSPSDTGDTETNDTACLSGEGA